MNFINIVSQYFIDIGDVSKEHIHICMRVVYFKIYLHIKGTHKRLAASCLITNFKIVVQHKQNVSSLNVVLICIIKLTETEPGHTHVSYTSEAKQKIKIINVNSKAYFLFSIGYNLKKQVFFTS